MSRTARMAGRGLSGSPVFSVFLSGRVSGLPAGKLAGFLTGYLMYII